MHNIRFVKVENISDRTFVPGILMMVLVEVVVVVTTTKT
jgi:hypothetical protein